MWSAAFAPSSRIWVSQVFGVIWRNKEISSGFFGACSIPFHLQLSSMKRCDIVRSWTLDVFESIQAYSEQSGLIMWHPHSTPFIIIQFFKKACPGGWNLPGRPMQSSLPGGGARRQLLTVTQTHNRLPVYCQLQECSCNLSLPFVWEVCPPSHQVVPLLLLKSAKNTSGGLLA